MNQRVKRVLALLAGWAFLLLGIVGLFVPFLQGMLFILIGLIILSSEYVWAHHLLAKLKARFPRLGHLADEGRAKASLWLQRLSGQRTLD